MKFEIYSFVMLHLHLWIILTIGYISKFYTYFYRVKVVNNFFEIFHTIYIFLKKFFNLPIHLSLHNIREILYIEIGYNGYMRGHIDSYSNLRIHRNLYKNFMFFLCMYNMAKSLLFRISFFILHFIYNQGISDHTSHVPHLWSMIAILIDF